MNIQVKVIVGQARAQLAQLQRQFASLNMEKATAGARSFGGALNGSRIDRFGSQMQWLGRQIEYNFTLPILAAGAGATKFALDNEAAMTRVSKVYGDGTQSIQDMEAELDSLGRAFVALSNHFGVAQSDVINIAADWAAAGASGLALAKSVQLTLKTMVLGEMEAVSATRALIAIQAQYGLTVQDLTDVVNILNMVENQTGTSLKDLIDGYSRVAGVARSAGIGYRELAADIAALVPATGSAANAGNGLKTIISRIMAPAQDTAKAIESMGINMHGMAWESSNGQQKLIMLAQSFTKLSDGQRNLVASMIAGRYQVNRFTQLMNELVNNSGYYSRAMQSTADSTRVYKQSVDELNKVLLSNPQRLKQIWVMLQNAAADIIQPLIPLILYLANSVQKLVTGFSDLNPAIQRMILFGVVALAAVGPIVRYVGAFQVLLFELAKITRVVLMPFTALWSLFGLVGSAAKMAGSTVLFLGKAAFPALRLAVVAAYQSIVIYVAVFQRLMAISQLVALTLGPIWRTALLGVQRIFMTAGPALRAVWLATMMSIQAITIAWGSGFPAVWSAIMLGVQRIIAVAAPGITGIWGLTLLAMQRFTAVSGAAIAALWQGMILAMRVFTVTTGGALYAAWTGLLFRIRTGTVAGVGIIGAAWQAVSFVLTSVAVAAWTSVRIIFVYGATAVAAITRAFAFALNFIMAGMGGAIAAIWAAMWRTMASLSVVGWTMVTRIWVAGRAGIIALMTRFIPAMRAIGTAIAVAFSGPWGWVIAAVIALIILFRKQIVQIFTNIVNWFRGNSNRMGQALNPFSRAAIAVRNVVVKAFNSLPEGIRNALIATVKIIQSAAEQIYHWFSYINPFARHSPSLVDNVKTGVAVIQQQFGQLRSVGSSFSSVANDLRIFSQAVRKVQDELDTSRYNDIRDTLAGIASYAIPSFNRLVAELRVLQDQLDALKPGLDAQQAVVDEWKNRLNAANNELTIQKDILDSLNSQVDNFQGTVDTLNGSLELLTGARRALQDAGAGSEILKTYDDQIKAVDQQKKGIQDQLSQAQKAYADQKKLVDDLTLSRDQLQVSYDLEQQKLQAIQDQYDGVRQRIQDITSAIGDFESAVNSLNAAKGKGPDAFQQNFDAASNANFPDVGGTGTIGREMPGITDQSALIDDFTKSIANDTKNLFGQFDMFKPIRDWWDKAWNWIKSTFGPLGGSIGDFFSHLFDNVGNPLSGVDLGGYLDTLKNVGDTLKSWWDNIWGLIGPPLKEIGKIFGEQWKNALDSIGPQLKEFKDLIGPAGNALKNMWEMAKPLAALLGGVLLLALNIVIDVFKNALGPVLDAVITIIKSVIQIFRGLIEFFIGVFTGDWDMIWKGLSDIVIGTWNIIWGTIKNVGLLLWGIVKGIVEGVVDFFIWLKDVLVGHSIIPDMVNAIWEWLQKLAQFFKDAWDAIWSGIKFVLDLIVASWNWWWGVLKSVFETVGKALFNVIMAAWDGVKNFFKASLDFLKGIWDAALRAMTWVYDNILAPMFGALRNAISFTKDIFKQAVDGIRNIWDGLKAAAKDPVDFVVGTVINKGLIKGWNWISDNVLGGKFHVNPIPGYKTGGPVKGPGTERSDSVFARLSRGEYVIPAKTVREHGVGFFNWLIGRPNAKYPGDGSRGLAFADGGLVGQIWDAFSNPGKVLNDAIGGLLSRVPGSGAFKDMAKSVPGSMVDKMVDRAKSLFSSEGPVGQAMTFLEAQMGKPYIWAAAGPDGYDCSGIVSAIWNIMHNRNPYQHTFSTMNEAQYFPKSGPGGLLWSAWTNPGEVGIGGGDGVGHTMGVLAGKAFQSVGGRGVMWGGSPGGFAHIGHYDRGGWLMPGDLGMNFSKDPEPVFNSSQWRKIDAVLEQKVFSMDRNTAPMNYYNYNHTEVHFHGNLEFPNVKNGSDAEEFIKNLESLARGV